MDNLNAEWMRRIEKWSTSGKPRNLPNCPKCEQPSMERWDAWLVTGETCTTPDCGFGSSEGSGCLV